MGAIGFGCTKAHRGVEQRQLVGLITQRSAVRVRPPQPKIAEKTPPNTGGLSCFQGFMQESRGSTPSVDEGLTYETACDKSTGAFTKQ